MHPIRQAPLNLSERPLTPEQILAGAVFGQALIDARNVHESARFRASATAFLLEAGEMVTFWASVAGLDRELVREQAQQCLTEPAPIVTAPRRSSTRRLLTRARRHEPIAVSAASMAVPF